MARAAATTPRRRSRARTRRLRVRLRRWLPSARQRRRWLRAFRGMPPGAQVVSSLVVLALLWALVNVVYQVVRKPTELFFPVSGTLFKTPAETWNAYATLFRRHSTDTMSPALLAALAQVEGSGNPIARTYWRWSWRAHPFEVYRPASSAVGMFQITDGTFEEARRYCIHRHVVAMDGPWYAWRSCWFNWLYFRIVPSHAVELTSAYLDRAVAGALERHGIRNA